MRGEDGKSLLFTGFLNPGSVKKIVAYIEAVANDLPAESRRQSKRLGDFVADHKKRWQSKSVFNRTVTLRDSWQPKR